MESSESQHGFNDTRMYQVLPYQRILNQVNPACYLFICAMGLLGNGLVIYVVLTYAKMKTVTNIYILNLAITDMLFLFMLPLTVTTVIIKHWVFGFIVCKVYFVLCAVNIFGGAFNLCLMSADRYMAVCHPILSLRYRTPGKALCLCLLVWLLSFLVMLPVVMYTTTVEHHSLEGKYSCKIEWPPKGILSAATAFVWYSFILGFIIPVTCISVLYILILVRLRRVGAAKHKENRRSRGRVTRLIFSVVTVFVVCWLPYWCFQVHANFNSISANDTSRVLLINSFTILSYANSMLNPLLYAFLSDNFRQSFLKAFKWLSCFSISRLMSNGNSVLPLTNQTNISLKPAIGAKIELSVMDQSSDPSQALGHDSVNSKTDSAKYLLGPNHVK